MRQRRRGALELAEERLLDMFLELLFLVEARQGQLQAAALRAARAVKHRAFAHPLQELNDIRSDASRGQVPYEQVEGVGAVQDRRAVVAP